jgi:hypothetical protein
MRTSTPKPRRIVPFVKAACEQAMAWYDAEKLGASRLAIGNAIRLMCRAAKSREGDHFAAAVGLGSLLEGFAPEIPDWANDQHTLAGRKLGRGLDHFRKEGAKLVPPPTAVLAHAFVRAAASHDRESQQARTQQHEAGRYQREEPIGD